VQQALRTWFAQWGLPAQLRVDDGAPRGSWDDLPPELALWAIRLGVTMVWNCPRRRQDNAGIERAHGVGQRWGEPAAGASCVERQARLPWATTRQRERIVALAGHERSKQRPSERRYVPRRVDHAAAAKR
jgi:hypothetical protein